MFYIYFTAYDLEKEVHLEGNSGSRGFTSPLVEVGVLSAELIEGIEFK